MLNYVITCENIIWQLKWAYVIWYYKVLKRDIRDYNIPQTGVYDLLKMLEIALDEGYSVLKYTIVNKREIEDLIERI